MRRGLPYSQVQEPIETAALRVRLLEVEPDLGTYLSADERHQAAQVAVRVRIVRQRELDVDELLSDSGAFAAVILEGVLLHRMAIGDQPALRLLGPGDMLARAGDTRSSPLVRTSYHVPGELRLAMLDDRVLLTARRFPNLFTGLQTRMGEQHQRLATQLAICQLPRVEDRVLALLWLLAETWGRVTPSGTVVPLALTHDALGELVGARRPTVTLALKELSDRGAVFRQAGQWLLLHPPPHGSAPRPPHGDSSPAALRAEPEIGAGGESVWRERPREPAPDPGFEQLEQTVSALRRTHDRSAEELRSRLDRSRRLRERSRELRRRVAIRQTPPAGGARR